MGNGVEIMKFNFDTDHSGKLAGPPQPGRDGLGKRQKHFQGSGPFGDIGGKGCGIPNAFGGMTVSYTHLVLALNFPYYFEDMGTLPWVSSVEVTLGADAAIACLLYTSRCV